MSEKATVKTSPSKLKDIALQVDASKENTAFAHYGHKVTPIMARSLQDDSMVDSGFKVWTTNGEYKTILRKGMVFYPHEEVEKHISNILKDHKVKGLTQDASKKVEVYDRRFGFIKYWKFMTDKTYVIKGSKQKNDVVNLGIVIRNGIGTNTALGGDIFTERVICTNGAVARGKDFGFALKHVGKFAEMEEAFVNGLHVIFTRAQDLMGLYEDMCSVKTTQKAIEQIYQKTSIADKYWDKVPYIEIDEKAKKIEDKVKFQKGKDVSLFETFNDLTNPLTRAFESQQSFSRLYDETVSLHRQMDILVSASKGQRRRLA